MSYSNLKELLKDERIAAVAARVAVHDGETRHWYVNEEGDYVVTVVTLQHGVPIDANWHNPPGEYSLPEVNDEVLVGFDDGEFEGEAYIICRTSGGVPVADGESGELVPGQLIVVRSRAETRATTKVLLQAPTVEAASAPGDGKALAYLDQLEALRDAFLDWIPVPNDGGAALKTILNALFSGPPSWPQGTTVLKGE